MSNILIFIDLLKTQLLIENVFVDSNKSLDSKIQKSSKNKQDPEINMSQELSQNEGRKADQRRRSKRIRDKMSKIAVR